VLAQALGAFNQPRELAEAFFSYALVKYADFQLESATRAGWFQLPPFHDLEQIAQRLDDSAQRADGALVPVYKERIGDGATLHVFRPCIHPTVYRALPGQVRQQRCRNRRGAAHLPDGSGYVFDVCEGSRKIAFQLAGARWQKGCFISHRHSFRWTD